MDLETVLGMTAGFCTTIGLVPQVWRIARTRHVRAISARSYGLTTVGLGLWFGYGLAIDSLPVILYNGISCLLAGSIVAMKLHFGRTNHLSGNH
ncbi:SemiSWEET family sugar transporter [Chitinimonas lacunae]|uniref:SemiSWEET family sugar transporter n=1 Tax=Chitinimonas lacunae TaxID=1963018 RepID=A0ABV8MVF0_9NEIS